jgi:hypothetical protein
VAHFGRFVVQKEAAKKVNEAAENTKAAVLAAGLMAEKAVERLAMQVLESQCEALGRLVRRIQQLAASAMSSTEKAEWRPLWQEVAQRCRECSDAAGDALAVPHLTTDEREALAQQRHGIGNIASFIDRNRLPADKNGKLATEHGPMLEKLFIILTNVRHRARGRAFEANNAN